MAKHTTLVVTGVVVTCVAGALAYAVILGVPSTESVGGLWHIESREYPAGSHRSSPTGLYHRRGGREELVDRYVSDERYYGDDCVAYVTLKTGDKQYFGVCGDREPVLLATESEEEWVLEADGMQKRSMGPNSYHWRPTTKIGLAEIKGSSLS
jgi:hypothetical protein